MPKIKPPFPFRLGTTSYIIPDNLTNNVNYLASLVEDVELVLFELEDGTGNFPDHQTTETLARLAQENDLTYTVHLPQDLYCGDGAEDHLSLQLAKKVIRATQPLDPWAYVTHLDGRSVRSNQLTGQYSAWVDQAVHSLLMTADWCGGLDNLVLENLEGYPLDFLEPVTTQIPVPLCIDIGHLWLDKHDPIPYLQKHIARTRVIHLHGIHDRDHTSLAHMPITIIDEIFSFLLSEQYIGVLTLEVFCETDFLTSLQMIREITSQH